MSTAVGEAAVEVVEVVPGWHKMGIAENLAADGKKLHSIFTGAVEFAQMLRRQRAREYPFPF